MRNIGRWVLAGTLAVGGLGGGMAFAHGTSGEEEQGKKVTMGELPSAVQSTFQSEAKGGQVEELHSLQRNGKTVYKGEIVSNGKGTELQVSENGKILKRSASHNEAAEHQRGEE